MPYKDREAQLAAQKRHYENNKAVWRQRNERDRDVTRNYIEAIKNKNPCKRCGETDIRVLMFHHRDPAEKDVDFRQMVRDKWRPARIDAEVAKCDVMCANCHIIIHWEIRAASKVKITYGGRGAHGIAVN